MTETQTPKNSRADRIADIIREKISTKNVLTIDINSTLEDAVKKMASSNLRNIIVTENIDNLQKYYLLTIDILIDFKLKFLKKIFFFRKQLYGML